LGSRGPLPAKKAVGNKSSVWALSRKISEISALSNVRKLSLDFRCLTDHFPPDVDWRMRVELSPWSSFPPVRGLGGFVLQITLFFWAACAGMRPQPFGSIFLILRRVGGGANGVSRCFPSSPQGRTLATYLASSLTRPLRKAYSSSVKVPQRWQRNERSQWAYRRL
jgi:hypothetical protein